jgi:3-deoxy-D-manno-octulosonic-acid transferase
MSRLTLIVYNFGFLIFSILYLPIFILKGKMSRGSASRFGHPSKEQLLPLKGGRVVWLHAVSVGEIGLAVRWASQLKRQMPDAKILFTTTTVTGYEVASKIKSKEDALCYFPIDWPWAVSSFIREVSPSLVLLFETEIWPNLIHRLALKNIPVFIVNGRISDRAFKSYLKVRGFLKIILNELSGIGVQDEDMRARFIRLGAQESRVRVTGNLKFEWTPNEQQGGEKRPALDSEPALFTWLCASTHEGEEEMVLDVFLNLKKRYPMRFILAPRHVDRVESIESMAQKKNITFKKYSNQFEIAAESRGVDALLVDKMGVLSEFYAVADAVFMGGSLVPVGGHNLVEPAYFGKAVIYGPYMQNFRSMTQEFEKGHASCCVKDKAALEEKLVEWICDVRKRVDVGEAARDLVARHRGAAQKNLDYVGSVLEQSFGRRLINV